MNVSRAPTTGMLEDLLDAFNRHDLDAIMNFFTESPVLEMPRGTEPCGTRAVGRENVRALLSTRFEGLPDVHYSEDQHFVCGDRGVSEWLLTGTTPEGQKLCLRGCDLFDFQGGKISRKNSFWKIVEDL